VLVLKRFIEDEVGATSIEYGLIGAVVAVIAIAAMTHFGESVSSKFDYIATSVTTATSGGS
jgi:pilus assembly protein Flp/PilA